MAVCAQQHVFLNVCHELLDHSHIPANNRSGELWSAIDIGSSLTKEAGRNTVGFSYHCCACKSWNSDLVNFLTSIMNLSRRSLSIPNHSRRIVLRKTVKYRKATCRAYSCLNQFAHQQVCTPTGFLGAAGNAAHGLAFGLRDGKMSASLSARSSCCAQTTVSNLQKNSAGSTSLLHLERCLVCMPKAVEDALPKTGQVLFCQVLFFGQPNTQSLKTFLPSLIVDRAEGSGKLAVSIIFLDSLQQCALAFTLFLLVHVSVDQ